MKWFSYSSTKKEEKLNHTDPKNIIYRSTAVLNLIQNKVSESIIEKIVFKIKRKKG